jgi:phage gp29-like protein
MSDLLYFTDISMTVNDEKNLSNRMYDYMNKNVNCDILFLNYGDELKKMYFLDDINKVFSDNCIIWRKNIHKIMGYFVNKNYETTNDFWTQCIVGNLNVMSSSNF